MTKRHDIHHFEAESELVKMTLSLKSGKMPFLSYLCLLHFLHTVIKKTEDDRCDVTIYDRFSHINTESFDGKPKHKQKAETTIYTDGSKTDYGVGAGFVIYHKNQRIHAESIHMLSLIHI